MDRAIKGETEMDNNRQKLNELKEEWLNERIFVDMYGRAYNLSDVPMTYMTRRKSFDKLGCDEADICEAWDDYCENNSII